MTRLVPTWRASCSYRGNCPFQHPVTVTVKFRSNRIVWLIVYLLARHSLRLRALVDLLMSNFGYFLMSNNDDPFYKANHAHCSTHFHLHHHLPGTYFTQIAQINCSYIFFTLLIYNCPAISLLIVCIVLSRRLWPFSAALMMPMSWAFCFFVGAISSFIWNRMCWIKIK